MEPQQSTSESGATPGKLHPLGNPFDLVKPAVEAVKNNWQAFVVVNILSVIAAVVSIFVGSNPDADSQSALFNAEQSSEVVSSFSTIPDTQLATVVGFSLVFLLLVVVIGAVLQAMATKLQLLAARGEQPSVRSLFEASKKYILPLIGLGIVSGLIILVGLVLLIVPGIIAIGRLALAAYHMVDKDLGVVEALRISNEQAKQVGIGKVWSVIGVIILLSFGGEILGVIPVFGALLAVAVTIIASMLLPLRYEQLRLHADDSAPSDEATSQPPQPPSATQSPTA